VDGREHRKRSIWTARTRPSHGADIVSTACPFCMIMLDDAVKANGKGDDVAVMDISQVVERSLTVGAGRPASDFVVHTPVTRR